jgi:predicted Zn-dependent protease
LKLKNRFVAILIALIPAFFAMQCQKENMGMISREQEIELGRKVDSMIINSPARFPILDTALYHNAYAYIDTMLSEILQSVHFQRKNAFNYQVRIIDRELLHAYATPGGYLYFYKGLINLLDNGAEFAGVMAHEMVHVDRRHITWKRNIILTHCFRWYGEAIPVFLLKLPVISPENRVLRHSVISRNMKQMNLR